MATAPARSPLHLSARLYERLLALYPAPYRAEYGPAMAQLFRDLAREAYGQRRGWGLAGLWVRVLADTSRTAGAEHWQALEDSLRCSAWQVDLAWMRTAWPGLLLATVIIVAGMAAKSIVLAQTQSAAAAAGVLVGAASLAAITLDRSVRAGGQLLAASAVVIVSLVLPLAWTPNALAWLKANPTTAYTVAMLPFAWQRGAHPWRQVWVTALIYAATNLIAAQLIGP